MDREPLPESFWDEDGPTEEQLKATLPKSQLAPKPARKSDEFEQIKGNLSNLESQFRAILPAHIGPEKFFTIAIMALKGNPELLSMDRVSLYRACAQAAADGLLLDSKEAALIPFKGKVKYSPMVYGLIKLCRQSGELEALTSLAVFEKDVFRVWIDEKGEHLEHIPDFFGDRGKRKGAYAIARMPNGQIQMEVMTETELLAVKNLAARGGPWSGPFEGEMVKKTVIRRLTKRLSLSPHLERAVRRDDEFYDIKTDPRKSGLAGELNAAKNGPENPQGDRIETLSDLRKSEGGRGAHQDQESEPSSRSMEPDASMPGSPQRAGPGVEELPLQIPIGVAVSGGPRVGNNRSSVRSKKSDPKSPPMERET